MNRSLALTIFMVVIGIVLLLPGVCALHVMAHGGFSLHGERTPPDHYVIYAICLVISAGGIFLLYKALHKTTLLQTTLLLIGVLLLVAPGIHSLFFIAFSSPIPDGIMQLWITSFIISAGALIIYAYRR